MELRKVLLRAMLWSLGFAAATGVLALLFRGGDIVWRVVGTGFLTAIACGVMMPVSAMVDRRESRSAGLLGMVAIIVVYLLVLSLIWELATVLFGSAVEERVALTALFVAIVAPVAMFFLGVAQGLAPASRAEPAGRIGVGLCGLVFIVLMFGTWLPRRPHYGDDWWATALALAIFGMLSVVCLVGVGTRDRRHWRWAGIASAVAACALWLVRIWLGLESDPGKATFSTLTCMAAVVAHANLSVLCPLTVGQQWVRSATVATVALTAALIDLLVFNELFRLHFDDVERFAAASGIVASCGTLSLLVLVRLNRNVDYEPGVEEILRMTVVCPRCRKKQEVPLGQGECSSCQLRIHIRIEEPRCEKCGYLLYGLTSERCPECGTPTGARTTKGKQS